MDNAATPMNRCHPRTRCTRTSLSVVLVVVICLFGVVVGASQIVGHRHTCTLETRQSAEQGDPEAAFRLAACLQTVHGVDTPSMTSSEFELSHAQDKKQEPDADTSLSLPFPPPTSNANSAIAWMEYSAELGYTRAIYQAAVWRDHLGDVSRAAAWYLQAAASGHTASQHDLAVCYKLGVGVEQSIQVSL